MDEKVLKGITVVMFILAFVVCGSMYYLPGIHEQAVLAAENKSKIEENVYGQVISVAEEENPEDILEAMTEVSEEGSAQIKMAIPDELGYEDITVENNYLTQTLYITFETDAGDYFSQYKMSGSSDHISSLSYYKYKKDGVVALTMDMVYEVETSFEDNYLYIDFINPHDIYDKVIVVDAGHGSKAAGAVKQKVEEKEINLAIVKKLKKLLDESDMNIKVYYTRTEDTNPTLDQRVQLANKANADLFISVHNNSSNSGNFTSLNGTQVLYSQSDKSKLSSKKLAKILLDNVCEELDSRKIGLYKGDDIYIIRNSKVPVALVEVGFMTNKDELSKLQDSKYQKKAARAIYKSIEQAFEEGY